MITQIERDQIVLSWIKKIHHSYELDLQGENYSRHSERFLSDLNNAMDADEVREAVDRMTSAKVQFHTFADLRALGECSYFLQHIA